MCQQSNGYLMNPLFVRPQVFSGGCSVTAHYSTTSSMAIILFQSRAQPHSHLYLCLSLQSANSTNVDPDKLVV